jgi:hypothetical protein
MHCNHVYVCVVIVIVIVTVIVTRLNAYCEIHSGKGQLQVRERLDSMAISDIVNKESWREINAYQKVKPIQKATSPKAQSPTHATQPTSASVSAAASAPAISLAPVSVPKSVVNEPKKVASKVETDKVKASKVKDEAQVKELDDSDEDFLRDTDKSNSDNDNESESESESDSDGDSERYADHIHFIILPYHITIAE